MPPDTSPGEVAVHFLNHMLSEATDRVLDDLSLAELMDQVARVSREQEMYYI